MPVETYPRLVFLDLDVHVRANLDALLDDQLVPLATSGSHETLQRLKERHRKAPDLILRQRDSKAPAAHPCTLPRIAPSGALPALRRGPHNLAEIEDYVYMT